MIKLLLIIALCLSCARSGRKDVVITSAQKLELLRQKQATYRDLIDAKKDQYGFIDTEECDALLFSGLLGSTSDLPVDLLAARASDKEWFRRPAMDCYPDYSKSSISRDMLLGVMAWAWQKKRLDILEDLWYYGISNKWVMGKGDLTRTIFTTNMQSLLARLIYRLGGTDHSVTRNIPIVVSSLNKGFQGHLVVVILWLLGEAEGKLLDLHIDTLRAYAKDQPNNAFYNYVYNLYTDGNQDKVLNTLLDTRLFPPTRLPTNKDRKTPWLWQRDEGSDWAPVSAEIPTKEHHGGDFLFLANLLLK